MSVTLARLTNHDLLVVFSGMGNADPSIVVGQDRGGAGEAGELEK
ncbi:MAG: hypothetical protein RL598_373 [Verrucomicrobiota bacterium]